MNKVEEYLQLVREVEELDIEDIRDESGLDNLVDRYRELDLDEIDRVELEAGVLLRVYNDERLEHIKDWRGGYNVIVGKLEEVSYSADAVYRFCEETDFERYEGIFVSALVDQAAEEDVRLPDMSDVGYVGYKNRKDVVVEGGVGSYAAEEQQNGTFHVKGDAGPGFAFRIKGGTAIVEGDVEKIGIGGIHTTYVRAVGNNADGGEIYLHGKGRVPTEVKGFQEGDVEVYRRKDGVLAETFNDGFRQVYP